MNKIIGKLSKGSVDTTIREDRIDWLGHSIRIQGTDVNLTKYFIKVGHDVTNPTSMLEYRDVDVYFSEDIKKRLQSVQPLDKIKSYSTLMHLVDRLGYDAGLFESSYSGCFYLAIAEKSPIDGKTIACLRKSFDLIKKL